MLQPIWFAALQPCGARLAALLPEWLPAHEQDRRRLDPDLRESLLQVSGRTLDRLLAPLRVNRHAWMLDGVDIRTDWTEQRALENRGQHCTLAQLRDVEASLPFALRGLDSDNGGEFLNHHVAAWLAQRKKPVLFTRARACRKNDNAHVGQRNWTHVRQHSGYKRYDDPAVVPLLNALGTGALGQLQNHFLPTHRLREKRREGNRTVRVYGAAQTPYARVLAAAEVTAAKKAELRRLHGSLNPFQLGREIERQKQAIAARRLWRA